jgi:hypothetical protein
MNASLQSDSTFGLPRWAIRLTAAFAVIGFGAVIYRAQQGKSSGGVRTPSSDDSARSRGSSSDDKGGSVDLGEALKIGKTVKASQTAPSVIASGSGENPSVGQARSDEEKRASRARNEVKLVEALSSSDSEDRRAAIEALTLRKSTANLPKLIAMDLKDPYVSPTLIAGIGKLGGLADAEGKQSALRRLQALLQEQKASKEPDAPGNVLQIIEALGDLAMQEAAAELEKESLDPSYPTAAQTLIVQSLEKLGFKSSLPALGKLKNHPVDPNEELGEELNRELREAVAHAISEIQGRP